MRDSRKELTASLPAPPPVPSLLLRLSGFEVAAFEVAALEGPVVPSAESSRATADAAADNIGGREAQGALALALLGGAWSSGEENAACCGQCYAVWCNRLMVYKVLGTAVGFFITV